MKKLIFLAILCLALFGISTQVTIFSIPPVGPITDGKTIVMKRPEGMNFIDSAAAVCQRENGTTNIFCQGVVLAKIAKVKEWATFPYNELLYKFTTGGTQKAK